ncbi:MAG: tetratricopeptide repeat protein [Pirellulales bacterium]
MPRLDRCLARRRRSTARRVLLLTACLLAICGCRTFGPKRGPQPQAVATCRQLTEQGISAMERGDWKRAESLLARAVDACPVDVDARRHYAESLAHRQALSESLTQFEEARKLVETDPTLAVRAGEVYLAIGQSQKAQAMADEALRLDPKHAPAWTLRGRVAGAAGQPRQALASYQRALGYEPDSQATAILVAETYRQLNQPERALVTLQAVSSKCAPGDEPQQVLYLEGIALAALGRYDEATRNLAQAARADRPSAEILCAWADAELHTGNLVRAQACVQEALLVDPQHSRSRALMTRLAGVAPPAPAAPAGGSGAAQRF